MAAITERLTPTLALGASVETLPGVSTKRSAALRKRGIATVGDLLETFPRRYLDYTLVTDAVRAPLNSECCVVGDIFAIKQRKPKPRLSLTEITLKDDSGILMVACFNQPWLTNKLQVGDRICVAGKATFSYGYKQMVNPTIDVLDTEEEVHGYIVPLHPASQALPPRIMRSLVHAALEAVRGCYDPLPVAVRAKYRLPSRYQAYCAIHEPESMAQVNQARRRFIYEELFFVELRLQMANGVRRFLGNAVAHIVDGPLLDAAFNVLPFTLTAEQVNAFAQISEALSQPTPMNHLLLGDVGTGKTILAYLAAVISANGSHQTLMIGPTEVLVAQYARSMGPLLDKIGVSWAVLTGSTEPEERNRIIEEVRQGTLSVLFGTHALLNEEVAPADLGLVIIDEQQRFGVDQRQTLIDKTPGVDVLSLTATPIPRSLALALYGDQTLSFLRQKPVSAAPRATHAITFEDEGKAYDAIRAALARGEQAFIVCPLIGISSESLDAASGTQEPSSNTKVRKSRAQQTDTTDAYTGEGNTQEERVLYAAIEWGIESDDLPAKPNAVIEHADRLRKSVFPEATIEVLHGKMKSEEKQEVMARFSKGEIDVLVSTTVVEVGIDVPNATVMVVEDADRFGLAQLHQLRGRVGRGSKPGCVYLVSRSKSPDAMRRLAALEQSEDGFALSEFDLANRAEGDIFGTRQSGASPLKLVNVIRDAAVIEAAYSDAQDLLKQASTSEAAARELALAERELQIRFGG